MKTAAVLSLWITFAAAACASSTPSARSGAAVATHQTSSGPTLSSERAEQMVAEGAKLVDVRTPEEYEAGHIEGAVNVPIDELPSRADELGDKHQPLILYCRSGGRASRGARVLKEAGFENVDSLGGMNNWKGPGAPQQQDLR